MITRTTALSTTYLHVCISQIDLSETCMQLVLLLGPLNYVPGDLGPNLPQFGLQGTSTQERLYRATTTYQAAYL